MLIKSDCSLSSQPLWCLLGRLRQWVSHNKRSLQRLYSDTCTAMRGVNDSAGGCVARRVARTCTPCVTISIRATVYLALVTTLGRLWQLLEEAAAIEMWNRTTSIGLVLQWSWKQSKSFQDTMFISHIRLRYDGGLPSEHRLWRASPLNRAKFCCQ